MIFFSFSIVCAFEHVPRKAATKLITKTARMNCCAGETAKGEKTSLVKFLSNRLKMFSLPPTVFEGSPLPAVNENERKR